MAPTPKQNESQRLEQLRNEYFSSRMPPTNNPNNADNHHEHRATSDSHISQPSRRSIKLEKQPSSTNILPKSTQINKPSDHTKAHHENSAASASHSKGAYKTRAISAVTPGDRIENPLTIDSDVEFEDNTLAPFVWPRDPYTHSLAPTARPQSNIISNPALGDSVGARGFSAFAMNMTRNASDNCEERNMVDGEARSDDRATAGSSRSEFMGRETLLPCPVHRSLGCCQRSCRVHGPVDGKGCGECRRAAGGGEGCGVME